MKLAGLIMFINDIHAMGLPATQGMYLTDSWYWNSSDAARAWSREFFKRHKSMPSSLQAADYSAALQYLRAVKATGTDDADKVLAYLRANKLNDLYLKDGVVRPTAAWSTTCTCCRSRRRNSPRNPGTTSTWCRPSTATRPSPRRRKAAARCGNKPRPTLKRPAMAKRK